MSELCANCQQPEALHFGGNQAVAGLPCTSYVPPQTAALVIRECARCRERVNNGGIPKFYPSTESDTTDHTYPAKVVCEQCRHEVRCGTTREEAVAAWNEEQADVSTLGAETAPANLKLGDSHSNQHSRTRRTGHAARRSLTYP